jgi:two-component system, OmpR family, response regulator CpxR
MNSKPVQHNRILVIDDDIELCDLVKEYLNAEGFEVDLIHTGLEAVARIETGAHELAVLDVMLPEINGFEVLRRIRSRSRIPVLMLTARSDDVDRIVGLELGADDYLAKPFNPRELVARIHAVLRRVRRWPAEAAPARFVFEDLVLDTGTRTAFLNDSAIELTGVEFDLLHTLIQEARTVLNREELVKRILGREFSPFDRSIDMHVSNLRRKLGLRSDGSERIKSIRGIGYLYTRSTTW